MSSNKQLKKTLEKLSNMTGPTKKGGRSRFWSAEEGRNDILILPTEHDGDPFVEWWVHRGLVDPSKPWISVASNYHNFGETDIIHETIESLKEENPKGNKDIYSPLEPIREFYSPIIDLGDVESGVKWWRYGSSVLKQMETWLLSLDDDELPFYDVDEPQKVIVHYNPDAAPKDKYKLDKKNIKPYDEDQIDEWLDQIKPIEDVVGNVKDDDELSELLASYIKQHERRLDQINVDDDNEDEEEEEKPRSKRRATSKKKSKKRSSKLDSLKD